MVPAIKKKIFLTLVIFLVSNLNYLLDLLLLFFKMANLQILYLEKQVLAKDPLVLTTFEILREHVDGVLEVTSDSDYNGYESESINFGQKKNLSSYSMSCSMCGLRKCTLPYPVTVLRLRR